MRILHVVPTYIPAWRYGGPIRSVHGLCKAQAAQGYEIHVFTTNVDGPVDSDVPLSTAVDIDGVQVWYFPSKRLRRLYYSPPMKDAMKDRMREFDLVHLHSIFLWPTWAAARIAYAVNIPYVISPRGMLVKSLVRHKSRLLKSMWLALVERRNIEQASAIHVTSEVERTELEKFDYQLPEICTVPNGVEMPMQWSMDEVSEDIRSVIEYGDYVLYLGRINWKKGLDRLLNVWARVPRARIVIAGNDEEHYIKKLVVIINEAGISDRVTFIARSVTGVDKEALFANASLFILPSYSENYGITVLEAMVRQCPVVVTPEVGAAEIVKKAGAGEVVEAADLDVSITELLSKSKLRKKMGRHGSEWVKGHCTWQMAGEKMMDCYRGIDGVNSINEGPVPEYDYDKKI